MSRGVTNCFIGLSYDSANIYEETPYKLVFGSDAVILIEIVKLYPRMMKIDEYKNDEVQRAELNRIEEERKIAKVKKEAMKLQVARKYNHHVSPKSFQE